MEILDTQTEQFSLAQHGTPWFRGELGGTYVEAKLSFNGLSAFEQVDALEDGDLLDLGIQEVDIGSLRNAITTWKNRSLSVGAVAVPSLAPSQAA